MLAGLDADIARLEALHAAAAAVLPVLRDARIDLSYATRIGRWPLAEALERAAAALGLARAVLIGPAAPQAPSPPAAPQETSG